MSTIFSAKYCFTNKLILICKTHFNEYPALHFEKANLSIVYLQSIYLYNAVFFPRKYWNLVFEC